MGLIEAADGGTLFLDEIANLNQPSPDCCVSFRRAVCRIGAVTSKTVDVRLIWCHHRDLSQLASQNQFRQDLFTE